MIKLDLWILLFKYLDNPTLQISFPFVRPSVHWFVHTEPEIPPTNIQIHKLHLQNPQIPIMKILVVNVLFPILWIQRHIVFLNF
jgi:hypothetical protein